MGGDALGEAWEPPDTLASLLRRFRRRAGITQEELAEHAGLSAKAVSALERGERRLPRPLAWASALGWMSSSHRSSIMPSRPRGVLFRGPRHHDLPTMSAW